MHEGVDEMKFKVVEGDTARCVVNGIVVVGRIMEFEPPTGDRPYWWVKGNNFTICASGNVSVMIEGEVEDGDESNS
jgi:hypothetical protein